MWRLCRGEDGGGDVVSVGGDGDRWCCGGMEMVEMKVMVAWCAGCGDGEGGGGDVSWWPKFGRMLAGIREERGWGLGKPPLSFDELMSTPIDFSAYVMNHLKIDNLTQEHLVGPTFNLLKETCKSRVELECNIEECYKAVTDRLDWNNPEGKEYPFDLSKPLPLIMERGRQVIHVDYFINNDLEYLTGGSSSKKYTTSTTKTKVAKYDIPG
ncbi:hypothetical protein Tco_1520095, partial [Tanacetum coccineum]